MNLFLAIQTRNFATRSFHTVALLAFSILLSSCAVGPDFQTPAAPNVRGYTKEALPAMTAGSGIELNDAQRFAQGKDIPAQWWMMFHSPGLNAVINRALQANPNLQAAQAALQASQENLYALRGSYLPSVNASLAPSRQKIGQGISSPLVSGDTLFNLHTAQLNISYGLDAFGGLRRQVENLQAQADAQKFQLEATYLTLISNVVLAAIQEASLREQIAATRETIQVGSQVLELMRSQFDLGAIAMADVVAQQAVLAQAQATLPTLQKQLAQQRTLLTALTGSLPDTELNEKFQLAALHLPQILPVSLPSKLVEQRPDIRSAAAQLHAATTQVGIAKANMLPQLTLTASLGSSSDEIGKLFSSGTGFWSLIGGLTQPIFSGGSLLHKKRAADAALEQAAAQYRGTVVTAFQNVADSLRALQYDAATLKAQAASEHAAAQSLAISRRALQLGAISYLSVLNAEQTYQQARVNLAQAQASRYADTVALFQALGGGWWNREDAGQPLTKTAIAGTR